jgi:hypothetical protein
MDAICGDQNANQSYGGNLASQSEVRVESSRELASRTEDLRIHEAGSRLNCLILFIACAHVGEELGPRRLAQVELLSNKRGKLPAIYGTFIRRTSHSARFRSTVPRESLYFLAVLDRQRRLIS